ncbi:MAG: hypothetical protein NTY19_05325 [Planctomycetota bacterium]|nr:hypothetical protein [Planctomycetota bacterium]
MGRRCEQTFLCVLLLLVVSGTTGCGSSGDLKRAAVEGSVTLDGTVLEEGTISFLPTAGTTGPAGYSQIVQGKYSIDARSGPAVGKNLVQILAYRDLGNKTAEGEAYKNQVVPDKYNSASTLVVETTQGKNSRSFDLKSK